ncbi:alpha/beta fold hydrolase [Ureibacillus xyleni]|uniref:alpha/beta fold hydrolase n=1 Tax=Ureibacillus xyleni TaxID=614648 RepID=UPI00192A2DF1|nr:alpha/beta hydrolase [Ureibacillus xyleni]
MPKIISNGVELYYEVKGEGVPIIFIHPPLLSSTNFTYQLEHLSKKYQIIVFDIRGHGRSGYSKHPVTYPLIVKDVLLLLETLKIKRAFFCGYSTGGSVLLELLLLHPERAFGGIIISGMSEVNDWKLKLKIATAIRLSKKKTIGILAKSIVKGNSDTRNISKKLKKASVQGHPVNIQQYLRYSMLFNCTELLTKIEAPVLLVYGSKDKTFLPYAQILHSKLPNNELVILNQEQHHIPTKAPHKLHEAIHQFIQAYKMENPFMI